MHKFAPAAVVVLALLMTCSGELTAQDPVDRDITTALFGNDTGPKRGGKNGVKVRNSNGNKIINVKEDKRDIQVVVRSDGHIFVNITKHFGPHELDNLIRREPSLEEYIKSFPKTAGDKDVHLSIGLTTRYDAPNEQELRDKNIAAFNLYKKFSRQTNQPYRRIGGQKKKVRDNLQRQIGPFVPGDNGPVKTPDPGQQNEGDQSSGGNNGGAR